MASGKYVLVCMHDVCRSYGDNRPVESRERKRGYSARVGMKREINEPGDELMTTRRRKLNAGCSDGSLLV